MYVCHVYVFFLFEIIGIMTSLRSLGFRVSGCMSVRSSVLHIGIRVWDFREGGFTVEAPKLETQ